MPAEEGKVMAFFRKHLHLPKREKLRPYNDQQIVERDVSQHALSELGEQLLSTTSHPPPIYLLPTFASSSVISGSINKFVKKPKYVDENEWIAQHVWDFAKLIEPCYESIRDECTNKSCPTMTVGPNMPPIYWPSIGDGSVGKLAPSNNITAPLYIERARNQIDQILSNSTAMPTRPGEPFTGEFINQVAKPIVRLLFLIMAHIYEAHFRRIIEQDQVGHLNAILAHFIAFVLEFDLLPAGEVHQPLGTLLTLLFKQDLREQIK